MTLLPTGQTMHFPRRVFPRPEILPGGHGVHEDDPEVPEYVSSGHRRHGKAPLGEKLPGRQGMHLFRSVFAAVPGAQSVHEVEFTDEDMKRLGHGRQFLPTRKLPIGQSLWE